jgi:hypothetical protein
MQKYNSWNDILKRLNAPDFMDTVGLAAANPLEMRFIIGELLHRIEVLESWVKYQQTGGTEGNGL